jgi:hypothetical protein
MDGYKNPAAQSAGFFCVPFKIGDPVMPTYPLKFVVLILFFLSLLACSSPDSDLPPPATEISPSVQETPGDDGLVSDLPTAATDETAAATSVPPETAVAPTTTPFTFPTPQPISHITLTEGGLVTEEITLPPLSLYDYLQASSPDEERIPGELLLLAMQSILGQEDEVLPIDNGPDSPLYMGMGFLDAIQTFIASDDSDPDLREEVARLFDILFPSLEQIEAYTAPGEQSRPNRGTGLAAWAAQEGGSVRCDEAWTDGLPLISPGVTDCFFSEDAYVGDDYYAVYYPAEWGEDTEKHALYEAALDAMIDSNRVYSEYGTMQDAVVIFSPASSAFPDGRGGMAVNWHADIEDDPCPIYVYGQSHGYPLEQFKQAIAHEMFHCYQAWNYNAIVQNFHTNAWWFEGTAEYFSNIVYPAADLEHRVVPHFDADSTQKSIFEMHHTNAVFFQHLANELGGPQSILDLVDSFDLTSLNQQQQVMRDFPDMINILHRLILAHMTVGIPDPGGTPLYSYHIGGEFFQPVLGAEGNYNVVAEPFVLKRYMVEYEPEKRFDQEGILPGDGRYSVAPREQRRDPAAWNILPEVVLGNCEGPKQFIAAVTTLDDTTPHLEIQVEEVQQADCDACVLGTWRLVPETFTAFMNQMVQEQGVAEGMPAGMSFEIEIGGDNLVQFLENRRIVTQRDGFQINVRSPGAPSVVTTIYGSGSGSYTADGEILSISNLVDVADEVTVTMDGQLMSATMGPDSGTVSLFGHSVDSPGFGGPEAPVSDSFNYTCEENLLTISIADNAVFDFERVERILPLPEAEPEVTPAP